MSRPQRELAQAYIEPVSRNVAILAATLVIEAASSLRKTGLPEREASAWLKNPFQEVGSRKGANRRVAAYCTWYGTAISIVFGW